MRWFLVLPSSTVVRRPASASETYQSCDTMNQAHREAALSGLNRLIVALRHVDRRRKCSYNNADGLFGGDSPEACKDVLIECLDDPYEPIRWSCWYWLYETGVIDLESLPRHGEDFLDQWIALKQECLKKSKVSVPKASVKPR